MTRSRTTSRTATSARTRPTPRWGRERASLRASEPSSTVFGSLVHRRALVRVARREGAPMTTLLVLPILLPLLAAALCILTGSSRAAQRAIGVTTLAVLVPISIAILVRVDDVGIIVVQAGDWPAPIGITVV